MIPEELPLQNLFNRLREYGLPLGTEEYMVALHAIQAGFGIGDLDALRKICSTLWIKSFEEAQLFNWLFDEMIGWFFSSSKEITKPKQAELKQTTPEPSALEEKVSDQSGTDMPQTFPTLHSSYPNEIEGYGQVVQAIRHQGQVGSEPDRLRFSLTAEYFPVTRRQMKQSWRYLRRMVREGPLEELDVIATVDMIGREGVFLKPVLLPRRINHAELVLLIDQGGSMVPFHALTRQLVETAQRGGRLRQAHVFYFHDYPADYLYRDTARLQGVPVFDVLQTLGEKSTVLIISDAGAARGNLDPDRITRTRSFIEQLCKSAHHCAWLNPMPDNRWKDSTAGEIEFLIPMFEMSQSGMNQTINILCR